MSVEVIRKSVKSIMEAMHNGRFDIEELEFLERFFEEGAEATSKVLERAREALENSERKQK